jgi:hypothetical protein
MMALVTDVAQTSTLLNRTGLDTVFGICADAASAEATDPRVTSRRAGTSVRLVAPALAPAGPAPKMDLQNGAGPRRRMTTRAFHRLHVERTVPSSTHVLP